MALNIKQFSEQKLKKQRKLKESSSSSTLLLGDPKKTTGRNTVIQLSSGHNMGSSTTCGHTTSHYNLQSSSNERYFGLGLMN